MARKLNYPTQQQPDLEPGDLSAMVSDFDELREQTYPQNDDEVEARIKWFFNWCIRHDRRPGVELLALALGTTRQTLWNWQQRDDRRGRAITQAKQVILSLLEQWGQCGKINPVSMIFLMKNHGAYRDQVEIAATPQHALEAHMTPAEIASRIEQDIPIDDEIDYSAQIQN